MKRTILSLLTAVVAALAVPGTAWAHVTVDSDSRPPRGGYGQVRLVVPTESSSASTVEVAVTLPEEVNLLAVQTLPIPGWTATIDRAPAGTTERVSRITWRAKTPENALGPKEFGIFTFAGGPWPTEQDTVSLPAEQRYSDGEVVKWDEVAVDDHTEAQNPAPVLTLGPESATDGAHGAAQSIQDSDAGSDGSSDWLWRTISLVSLLVAVGAIALAVLTRRGIGRN